jgi:hypothetical protein
MPNVFIIHQNIIQTLPVYSSSSSSSIIQTLAMYHHPSIIIQILPMYSSSTKVSIQALSDVCIHQRPSSTHPKCGCKVFIHSSATIKSIHPNCYEMVSSSTREKYPSKLLQTNSVVMHAP